MSTIRLMEKNAALDSLYDLKARKLQEQKLLSDEASEILVKLVDSNKKMRKSLQAGGTVVHGNIEYYNPPDEVKEIEKSKVLNTIAHGIIAKHKELDQINYEISQSRSMRTSLQSLELPVSNFQQWFEIHGKPDITPEKQDRMTHFSSSPKIYGGTTHHRSFKSSSSVMRKGRITN